MCGVVGVSLVSVIGGGGLNIGRRRGGGVIILFRCGLGMGWGWGKCM